MDYPGKVIAKTQVTPTQTSASGNWTLDDQAAAIKNNNWPVALVPNPISKSLRFNSADTAYLNRTFSTPTSQNIWSFSCWLKRNSLADQQFIFWAGTSATNDCALYFTSSDQIGWFTNNGVSVNSTSTAVFRDPSAWYHIVAIANSTTMNVYVNNQQIITNAGMTNNTINSAIAHCIGQDVQTSGNEFSGYMTEINFIDGQALTTSSFGLTNPQTGQWIPKKYTGTYGTNGFYLNFKDATSTTTLGYDYSGNANNWTTNNFSVTAGSGNDSLTDVPTPWVAYNTTGDVGGVVRGNYATLNPFQLATSGALFTLANGNLDYSCSASTGNAGRMYCEATMALHSGKSYWEIQVTNTNPYIGVISEGTLANGGTPNGNTGVVAVYSSGQAITGTSTATYSGTTFTFTTNDIIGFAWDGTALTLGCYKNGSLIGTWSNFESTKTWFPVIGVNSSSSSTSAIANFGQRPFAYTPPAGFRSLCTTNLPATTIGFGLTNQGGNYFNTVLRNGFGTAGGTVTTGFYPDFIWEKQRNGLSNHYLVNSIVGGTKTLSSNSTAAEATDNNWITAFSSTGYTHGSSDFGTGDTVAVWAWRANAGSTVSNTAGTITSTVSANTTAGFSIVTYTGNATSGATVGHGLGVAPNLIIVRNRTASAQNWQVYSSVIGATKRLFLDLTDAENTFSGVWNNTAPTSTVFSLGNATDVNGNTNNFVAYCFAAVAGYSAFGSYTGNGSTDGPFVYLGFRPAFVLWKRSNGAESWWINDTDRLGYNGDNRALFPNASSTENTANNIDILSNGFKIRGSGGEVNASGGTYIYACFAESPFQFANAR